MANCILFHKWGKWEQYIWTGEKMQTGLLAPADIRGKWFEAEETRQKRICQRCGKMEQEVVRDKW